MKRFILLLVLLAAAIVFRAPRSHAAGNLGLAPGVSFDNDSSGTFPITGSALSDGLVPGEASIIFFGSSNCWNTAREAERVVKLYPQYRGRLHFVIVDLEHVAADQQSLVKRYYRGAIPTIAVIDSNGKVIYDEAGETAPTRGDTGKLQKLLDSAKP